MGAQLRFHGVHIQCAQIQKLGDIRTRPVAFVKALGEANHPATQHTLQKLCGMVQVPMRMRAVVPAMQVQAGCVVEMNTQVTALKITQKMFQTLRRQMWMLDGQVQVFGVFGLHTLMSFSG